jgi:hypothetical protein
MQCSENASIVTVFHPQFPYWVLPMMAASATRSSGKFTSGLAFLSNFVFKMGYKCADFVFRASIPLDQRRFRALGTVL